jgi:hypothetical protein
MMEAGNLDEDNEADADTISEVDTSYCDEGWYNSNEFDLRDDGIQEMIKNMKEEPRREMESASLRR